MTANLDHAVRLRRDRRLSDLYHSADLVLADGFPLVLASLLRGPRLPERVTGADLIEPVCAAASRVGASVFVVGTRLSVLSKACTHLVRPFPRLAIVGAHSPSRGFEVGHPECEEVAGMIREAAPDIVFVALGSPKQELWAEVYRHRLPPSVYICAGAGFDYLAGQPRRAPRVVRQLCLEWLWRLAREPRRLARRYALDLVYFPLLLAEHLGWLCPAAAVLGVPQITPRPPSRGGLAPDDQRVSKLNQ